jgi:hypothetical protein
MLGSFAEEAGLHLSGAMAGISPPPPEIIADPSEITEIFWKTSTPHGK